MVQKWALVLASPIMDSVANKKKLTATLIAVVLLAGTSNVGVVHGQQDFLTYENLTHGIKIKYPADS